MPTDGKALRTTVPDEKTRRRVASYAIEEYGGVSEMIRELIERDMHEKEVLKPGQGPIDLAMSKRGGRRIAKVPANDRR